MIPRQSQSINKLNLNEEAVYENPWIFNERPFLSSNIEDYYGFVYLIVNKIDHKKYIGRKYFYSKRGGKKSESDWKNYYGSSIELNYDISVLGKENFERYILSLHKTKGSTNYTEIEEQVLRRVITDASYYNKMIAGKYSNVDFINVDYNTLLHNSEWPEKQSKFLTLYNNNYWWINDGKKNKRWPKDQDIPVRMV